MKRATGFTLLTALAITFPEWAACQVPPEMERQVKGQLLFSRSLPNVKLTFAASFHYVGGQRFLLYGVADAEQHFFADADEKGRVRRFYWIQFEHFLPGNNEYYRYKPTHVNRIGELRFICDTKLYSDFAGLTPEAESDGARARRLISNAGFSLPQAAIRIRLIHLPEADRRSELMIIYGEALTPDRLPAGVGKETAADESFPQWPKIALQRARASLKIERR